MTDDPEVRPCPQGGCSCTHTDGCEYGFLEGPPRVVQVTDKATGEVLRQVEYQQELWCPTCWPEKSLICATSLTSAERRHRLVEHARIAVTL